MKTTNPASQPSSFDPDVIFSGDFLREAGMQLIPDGPGSFTRVAWKRGNETHSQGLLWVPEAPHLSSPLLTVMTDSIFERSRAQAILETAFVDHFMQLTFPVEQSELMQHIQDIWLAGRTLTPAIHVVPVDDDRMLVAMMQTWPVFGAVTPAALRYMIHTAFGQFRDVMIRAGLRTSPDLYPPGDTGPGQRDWLTTAELLQLVGHRWHWYESQGNEVQCQVETSFENGQTVELSYYLRYINVEAHSWPALYLRAHTNGGLARNAYHEVLAYNLQHSHQQAQGLGFPLSIDSEGDLVIRQLILCPARPSMIKIQKIIDMVELNLNDFLNSIQDRL